MKRTLLVALALVTVVGGSTGSEAAPRFKGTLADVYSPVAMAIDPGVRHLWVVNSNEDQVHIIDADDGTPIAIAKTGWFPAGIALDLGLRRAWVTNNPEDSVSVIDMDTREHIALISVARMPAAVAIDPVSHRVYVASGDGLNHPSYITVFDGITMRPLKRFGHGTRSLNLLIDAQRGRYYALDYGARTLTAFDLASDTPIGTVSTGILPQDMALDPAAGLLYISNLCFAPGACQHGRVDVVDVAALTKIKTVDVALRPDIMTLSPSTGQLLLADINTSQVWAANASTGLSDGAPIYVPGYPSGLLPDPAHAQTFLTSFTEGWVGVLADESRAPVARIDPHDPIMIAPVHALTGRALDDLSGVRSVRAVFAPPAGPALEEEATLHCPISTLSCHWSAPLPLLPGAYEVTVFATDDAGNVGSARTNVVVA